MMFCTILFVIFIIWKCHKFFKIKKLTKETQTCDKLETNYDQCESCEDLERGEEISSLVVLSIEKIKRATMYFIGWSNFRFLWSPTRFLPTTLRRVTISEKIGKFLFPLLIKYLSKFFPKGIHDTIWAMNSEQFTHGYYIAPVQNVCAMFTRIWSEISLGLLSDFKTTVYDIKSYQELVFMLVYYKACISYQVVNKTVSDYKEYKHIYDDMVRYAKIDKFHYPKNDNKEDN